MGIETADRDARFADPEIVAQRTGDNPPAMFDQILRQARRHLCQRAMHCQRYGAQRRSGEHHHRIFALQPADVGQKFGLPRIFEAHLRQLCLADRCGNHARGLLQQGETGRLCQRVKRKGTAFQSGMAGCVIRVSRIQDRQAIGKAITNILRPCDERYVDVKTARVGGAFKDLASSDHEEGGKSGLMTRQPRPDDDLRPDPRRIAERYSQRARDGGQLYSI